MGALGAIQRAKTSIMPDPSKCPICKRELPAREGAPAFGPFCSARCADIDLGRWLGQRYRVESDEAPNQVKNTDEDTDIE